MDLIPLTIRGETIALPLTKGLYTIIDVDMWSSVKPYKWAAHRTKGSSIWYARRGKRVLRPSGKRVITAINLHRVVAGANEYAQKVDHINGNGLDNRRSNLRVCSNMENNHNRHAPSRSRTGFFGVKWMKKLNKWQAAIKNDGKWIYLGIYSDVRDAAMAYDRAVIQMRGPIAATNFPLLKQTA